MQLKRNSNTAKKNEEIHEKKLVKFNSPKSNLGVPKFEEIVTYK